MCHLFEPMPFAGPMGEWLVKSGKMQRERMEKRERRSQQPFGLCGSSCDFNRGVLRSTVDFLSRLSFLLRCKDTCFVFDPMLFAGPLGEWFVNSGKMQRERMEKRERSQQPVGLAVPVATSTGEYFARRLIFSRVSLFSCVVRIRASSSTPCSSPDRLANGS